MKFNGTLIWTLIWSLFMGVTAISIGFGALFPSMNRISKPFVCPRGEMSYEQQVYHPYPGNTITTLTWYCIESQAGTKTEIGLLPMSLFSGLIYGFFLFLLILTGRRVIPNGVQWNAGKTAMAKLEEQQAKSLRDAQYSSHLKFDTPSATASDSKNTASRLQKLKDLRAANLISESEYEQKRAQILRDV